MVQVKKIRDIPVYISREYKLRDGVAISQGYRVRGYLFELGF